MGSFSRQVLPDLELVLSASQHLVVENQKMLRITGFAFSGSHILWSDPHPQEVQDHFHNPQQPQTNDAGPQDTPNAFPYLEETPPVFNHSRSSLEDQAKVWLVPLSLHPSTGP